MNEIFLENERKLFLKTYNRIPIDISQGEGVFLYDKAGNKYLDFFAGLAVNALGYAHPKIVEAVYKQISRFGHLSNNFITDVQLELAELLVRHSKMSKVFFTNSGTESVEAAIKIIRMKYGPEKIIYSMTDSFHGRTYGAMSLTSREKYKKGFEPFLPNTQTIKYNDVKDLEQKVNKNTAAIFLEFIQGEGGINVITEEFVTKLVELKNKFGFAIVSDGIQCGTGRTGKPYSHNHFDIKPDLIVTAKAIGGGLPLGALLSSEAFDDIFYPGKHGTTFGGNPVSCAAGIVVLKEVFENGLMEKVSTLGNYLLDELKRMQNMFPTQIKDVRGKGFMIGLELFYDGNEIVSQMRGRKILINCTNQNVLRLLPPLIVTKDEIDYFLFNLIEIFKEKNNGN